MNCEALIEVKVAAKETGKGLPSEYTPCTHPATVEVLRHFSGVKSNYCGVHSKRFQGRAEVTTTVIGRKGA